MTFGFLVGSRNFIRFFWISSEDSVLHGYDCIHCVAKSYTTTAYRWLFLDSLSSLKTLWSAVIKSSKCSALGTTVPARLLHEALVIFLQADVTPGSTFCSRLHWKFMRWLGSVSTPLLWVSRLCRSSFINQILWIPVSNQAIHAIYLFVLLLIPILILVLGFCRIKQWVSLELFTRTSTTFWYWIFGVSVDIKYGSCDEDGEESECVVEEELADKPLSAPSLLRHSSISWYDWLRMRGGSVFWFLRTILGFVAETASVSLRTLAFFLPLVTDTFSSFNAD